VGSSSSGVSNGKTIGRNHVCRISTAANLILKKAQKDKLGKRTELVTSFTQDETKAGKR